MTKMDQKGNSSLFTGEQLKEIGIKKALDSAEEMHEDWTKLAYDFFIDYLKTHNIFTTEEVRLASKDIVPEPPSKRAWGGIVGRLAKAKLIHRIGYTKAKNPKAHSATCTLWKNSNKVKYNES